MMWSADAQPDDVSPCLLNEMYIKEQSRQEIPKISFYPQTVTMLLEIQSVLQCDKSRCPQCPRAK